MHPIYFKFILCELNDNKKLKKYKFPKKKNVVKNMKFKQIAKKYSNH